jgi:hypothetical protein
VRLFDLIRGIPKPTRTHEAEPRELRVQRVHHRATLRRVNETVGRVDAVVEDDFARFESEVRGDK